MPPHPRPKIRLTGQSPAFPPRRHSSTQTPPTGADRSGYWGDKPGSAGKARVPPRLHRPSRAAAPIRSPARQAAAPGCDSQSSRHPGGRSPDAQTAPCPAERPAGRPWQTWADDWLPLGSISDWRLALVARQQGCSVGFAAPSCQSLGFFSQWASLPMDGCQGGNAIFSPNDSRYVSVYFIKLVLRDAIVARLWPNLGRIVRFPKTAARMETVCGDPPRPLPA